MANKLRIVSVNAADSATLVASTTAGTLVASNLKTNDKGIGWRATGTSATLTATWATSQTVGCVALPYCNLTPAATIRVRAYTEVADAVPAFDSTAILACPAAAVVLQGLGASMSGANAYAYGGGAAARCWFAPVACKKVVIDLVDAANAAGYVEGSRLVIGNYWTPNYNFERGAELLPMDLSKHYRTDAGTQLTEIGTRVRKLSIDLRQLNAADRTALMAILRGNGMSVPFYMSLFPESDDLELERDNQVFGKLQQVGGLSRLSNSRYAHRVEVEEI